MDGQGVSADECCFGFVEKVGEVVCPFRFHLFSRSGGVRVAQRRCVDCIFKGSVGRHGQSTGLSCSYRILSQMLPDRSDYCDEKHTYGSGIDDFHFVASELKTLRQGC